METHALNRLITEWLARAHPAPETAQAEWAHHGVALLPLGVLFAAVRLPGDLVHAAVGSHAHAQVAAVLQERLQGPVIHDYRTTGPCYYALINWGAGVVQQLDQDEDAPCLGKDTYLGVPRLDRQEPPGTYWTVSPKYDGNLCVPQAVRDLIVAGRQELAQHAAV
jgi:hypothetical protein